MEYSDQVTATIENRIISWKNNTTTISTCIRHAHNPSLDHANKVTLIHIAKQQLGQKVNNNRPGDHLKNTYELLVLELLLMLSQCRGQSLQTHITWLEFMHKHSVEYHCDLMRATTISYTKTDPNGVNSGQTHLQDFYEN